MIRFRVTDQAFESYQLAGKKTGLGMSAWMRKVLAEWLRANGMVKR